MAKFDVTKIFLGIFIMTFASKGVLATMSCFVCLPDYKGNDNTVTTKADTVRNEIKKTKPDADSCSVFVASGVDTLNKANSKLKDSNCNRCVKVMYKGDKGSFIGRGCERGSANFDAIRVTAETDSKYDIYYCDDQEYCNAAPSHFTGSFFSLVISLVAFSLKKFM